MKRFIFGLLLIAHTGGCAAQHAMYGGRIDLVEDQKHPVPGLILHSKEGKAVLCYAKPGESFDDLKREQWVVLEGTKVDEDMAIRLSDCEVVAVAPSEPSESCSVELRKRTPRKRAPAPASPPPAASSGH